MCTCYIWMSQVVVRVVEPAMERVPEIVMVAIVCQSPYLPTFGLAR